MIPSKQLSLAVIWTILPFLSGCFDKENITLTVLDQQILQAIPSASGVERIDNDIYVVSDNTPWLNKLNTKFETIERFQLAPFNSLSDSIYTKDVKPDFEAITTVNLGGEQELWVFGSGSKSPKRDILVRFNPKTKTIVQTHALTEFYKEIIASCGLGDGALNIEGAASVDGTLYLFNRGINLVLQYALSDFVGYLDGKAKCPKPVSYHIKLPQSDGVQAGFSGATISPDKNHIIYTASSENTENWIDDGEILGSYVGVISFKDLKNQYQPVCLPIIKEGKVLAVKVESATVLGYKQNQWIDLLLVTDSDGGDSERFKVRLD